MKYDSYLHLLRTLAETVCGYRKRGGNGSNRVSIQVKKKTAGRILMIFLRIFFWHAKYTVARLAMWYSKL